MKKKTLPNIQWLRPLALSKKRIQHRRLPVNFANFYGQLFWRTSWGSCFWGNGRETTWLSFLKEAIYKINRRKKLFPHRIWSVGMNIGDIAMIKVEDKKPSTWNIGIISDIFKGWNNKRSAAGADINWILVSTNPITMGIDTKMV